MRAWLSALFLALASFTLGGSVWAAGQEDVSEQQWVRMTHAAFRALFLTHTDGFTLRFFDDAGVEIAREFHAPDDSVYLDDYLSQIRSVGSIMYGEGEQFCYRYDDQDGLFCWNYFRSAQGYMEESADGDVLDFFEIEPGNSFANLWGADWSSRFR